MNNCWPGQLPPIGSFCHVNTHSGVLLVYIKQHPFNHHKRLTHKEERWGGGVTYEEDGVKQGRGGRKMEVVPITK